MRNTNAGIVLLAVLFVRALVGSAQKNEPVPSPQISGTVVDTSGAVIAGAAIEVQNADGDIEVKQQSDKSGSFVFEGLPPGHYRLVVSGPAFETKEIPISVGPTELPAPLRIALAVGSVSTAINVQGRADDLIGKLLHAFKAHFLSGTSTAPLNFSSPVTLEAPQHRGSQAIAMASNSQITTNLWRTGRSTLTLPIHKRFSPRPIPTTQPRIAPEVGICPKRLDW